VDLQNKYTSLRKIISALGKGPQRRKMAAGNPRVIVAYSGGLDSTFLLHSAVDTLGAENVLACIGVSPSLAKSQYQQAIENARLIGAKVEELALDELSDPQYSANKADRCFHCKTHLYRILKGIADARRFDGILCGSNLDDKDAFRPGERAAKDFGVRAPLVEASLTKQDIRELSRQLDLPTADVPASPCLASRISYGLEVTEKRLKQVEQAEDFLHRLGLVEFRVRHHGKLARIEVHPEDIVTIISEPDRSSIIEKFKSLGFTYVTMDLQGFRSGSLNESLSEQDKRRSV